MPDPNIADIADIDVKYTAFGVGLRIDPSYSPQPPGYYWRLFPLAVAAGPWIAGFFGLFNLNTEVWVWSRNKGLRPFVLTRRS